MRVAFLSDDFPPASFGGAGIVAADLATELAKRGHEVIVITTVSNQSDVGVMEYEGVKLYRLYSKYPERFRAWISLYNPWITGKVDRILREFKPDVVHAHNIHYHLSYQSLALAAKYTKKVFLTAHDAMLVHYGKVDRIKNISPLRQMHEYGFAYNPLRNLIIRHYVTHVKTIFAVSEALKSLLKCNGIKNVQVLHNGIATDLWRRDESTQIKAQERFGVLGKQVMLVAGRLTGSKGGYTALYALKKLADKYPNLVLLVAGRESDGQKMLTAITAPESMVKRVLFTGWVNRASMPEVYAATDLVLVLSKYLDPFPTVNLEAMASSRPVVGTSVGGTPEVVEDGVTGYLIDPHNQDGVAAKVRLLLDNKDLRLKMGDAGRERVETNFTLDKQVEELIRWYDKN